MSDQLHPEACTKVVAIQVGIINSSIVLLPFNNLGEDNTFMNFPNLFDNQTDMVFNLPRDAKAKLEVYDKYGKEVAILFERNVIGGQLYLFTFDASDLREGIIRQKYFLIIAVLLRLK